MIKMFSPHELQKLAKIVSRVTFLVIALKYIDGRPVRYY